MANKRLTGLRLKDGVVLLPATIVVLCMCWIVVKLPYGTKSYYVSSSVSLLNNLSHSEEPSLLPWIQGTNIKDRKSIVAFREHLRCISEAGRWVYNATPRHIPWNYVGDEYTTDCDKKYPHLKGQAAENPSITAQNWTVREALKWVWVTDERCPFQPVDRDELCRLIGARGNLMVVGDSINHQIQVSITNNLIKDPAAQEIRKDKELCRTCPGFPICRDVLRNGHEFNVSFVRNDLLSTTNEPLNGNWHKEWPWRKLIKEWDIKTLILNRGAHYQDDGHLLKVLNETFTFIKRDHPDLLLLYRNTPPGHVNCTPATPVPLETRQFISPDFKYMWQHFGRQNALTKALVEQYGFIYMDVESMLSLRQDGHLRWGDCMHYCVPGPLDSAVQLLCNTLKVQVKDLGRRKIKKAVEEVLHSNLLSFQFGSSSK